MSVMLYAISKSFKFMKKLQNSDSIYGRNINLSISDYKKNIIKLVFEGKVGRLSSNMQFLKERLVVFYNLFFMVYYILISVLRKMQSCRGVRMHIPAVLIQFEE